MGGPQKYTGKKGNCSFECGCAGPQLPLLLQQQFSILLEPRTLDLHVSAILDVSLLHFGSCQILVGSTTSRARICRSDNTDVTTNLCFHTSTATHSAFTPHDYLFAFTHQQFHTATITFLLSHQNNSQVFNRPWEDLAETLTEWL
jgi:hypothetical protein